MWEGGTINMNILILSDIHGNLNAFRAVKTAVRNYIIDGCVLLGDVIDYGMHSNEVIEEMQQLPYKILCNIRGNHEEAVISDIYDRFSSERGRECAKYTRGKLNENSWQFINNMCSVGKYEFNMDGKLCLAVHGSLKDNLWKSISINDDLSGYEKYDYVFSGHSHLPHFFERYYQCDNPSKRNKKKTIFLNPGSVGQPRNHNSMAQYAILDTTTEEIEFKKVAYDIENEQLAYYGQVDEFYKTRLKEGI